MPFAFNLSPHYMGIRVDIRGNGGWCKQHIVWHPTPHFLVLPLDRLLSIVGSRRRAGQWAIGDWQLTQVR